MAVTLLIGGALVTTWVISVIYTLFFDPLSNVPGPKLWACSRLPWIYNTLNGDLAHRIQQLHARYGQTVRIAPNEVSFTHPDAWKAVYAYRPGIGAFPKNPIWHATKPGFRTNNISTANTQDHTRIRKALQRGFAANNTARQEEVIKRNVGKFRRGLEERAKQFQTINVVDWMHFVSFDMVSELVFGKPIFANLDNGRYHPALQAWLTAHPHMNGVCMRMFPYVEPTVNYLKSLRFWKKDQPSGVLIQIQGAIKERIIEKDERKGSPDLMGALIEGEEEGRLSQAEMKGTAAIVQGGGGGTTASALSAAVNHLIRYPDTLIALSKEVRGSFQSQSDMTGENLERLPYLNAVIQETLRLCPPIATGVPRMVPPQGDTVAGYWLPGGTNVSVHQLSTNRSPHLWHQPNTFHPSRWLPDRAAAFASDHRGALHPFSLGPRRCIGEKVAWAEMRMTLATFVWCFDFEAATDPVPKWEDQKTYPTWQKKDFLVRVSVRDIESKEGK